MSIRVHTATGLTCAAAAGAALLISAALAAAPENARQAAEPRVIEIVAKRYAFEPAVIEVTEGESVRLLLRSADGVHGIGIKKFKVAEEIPRGGTPITIEFTANAVGRFPILCSEYCGKGHEEMKGRLVVKPRAVSR